MWTFLIHPSRFSEDADNRLSEVHYYEGQAIENYDEVRHLA